MPNNSAWPVRELMLFSQNHLNSFMWSAVYRVPDIIIQFESEAQIISSFSSGTSFINLIPEQVNALIIASLLRHTQCFRIVYFILTMKQI